MNDAVFYRKGIGDDDKAIADTKYFIKTFGKKKQGRTPRTPCFSLTSIYEKQGDKDAVIKHLRDYLRTYGEKGGDRPRRDRERQDRRDPVGAELPGEAGRWARA